MKSVVLAMTVLVLSSCSPNLEQRAKTSLCYERMRILYSRLAVQIIDSEGHGKSSIKQLLGQTEEQLKTCPLTNKRYAVNPLLVKGVTEDTMDNELAIICVTPHFLSKRDVFMGLTFASQGIETNTLPAWAQLEL